MAVEVVAGVDGVVDIRDLHPPVAEFRRRRFGVGVVGGGGRLSIIRLQNVIDAFAGGQRDCCSAA